MRHRPKLRRREFDAAWKKILEQYFGEFLYFYFPAIAKQIEHSKGYVFLDQELAKIAPKAQSKKRRVDRLVQVYLKGMRKFWLLVHLEVQSYKEEEFSLRMYSYHYRIFDRYQKPVASLAILADTARSFRPNSLDLKALGHTFVHFEFLAVKLLDWQGKEDILQKDPNPFALVTLASLKAYEKNLTSRSEWKYLLTSLLYERGYEAQTVRNLYEFLDGIMVLPDDLEIQYNEKITELEKEKKMPYITTAERIGIKKGKHEGEIKTLQSAVLDILDIRFGKVPSPIVSEIEKITDTKRLRTLHRQAVVVADVDAFQKLLKKA